MGATGLRSAEWGTPVVYTRAPDGVLFRLPEKPPVSVAQSGDVVNTDLRGATVNGDVNIGTGDRTVHPAADQQAADQQAADKLIAMQKRRLQELKLQKAMYGINADPAITIQIEDLEQELARLSGQRNGG